MLAAFHKMVNVNNVNLPSFASNWLSCLFSSDNIVRCCMYVVHCDSIFK